MPRSGRVPSVVLLLVASWASTATGQGWAESAVETRAFLDRSGRGDLSRLETSLVLRARYWHGWDKRSQRISVEAFWRIGLGNDRRTHLDFRELNWEKRWSNFELRAGVGMVSWGVIESASIVDVINQRDLLEGLDKRAKLGQPMPNLARDSGVVARLRSPGQSRQPYTPPRPSGSPRPAAPQSALRSTGS